MIKYNNSEIRDINNTDIKLAKMLIKAAFPEEEHIGELKLFGSKVIITENFEVGLFNEDDYYIVNGYAFTLKGETKRRWMYRILYSNDKKGESAWRFVHPNTNAAYGEEWDFDLKTLPFVEE